MVKIPLFPAESTDLQTFPMVSLFVPQSRTYTAYPYFFHFPFRLTLLFWDLVYFMFYASQLVFETAKAPFTKLSAGLIVGGGVFAGIGIVVGAITHQQYKHGES